ncbi:MAG: hypothetical protein JWR81_4835 [Pseudonocardia sp.]|nr:hypothetical protein [Pseudonocardia sp.]MDT7613113.1 hypothetical protein [Pseudonocardiales bacterium]
MRLVVRRVRPTPGSQLALFTDFDYHAMVTDRDGDLLQVEADHRRHAAWLALAVTAHNLGRPVGALAGMARATAATLRRRLFTIPGRLVHTARRLHLRLPANWPWAEAFLTALTGINALPMRS